MKIGRTVEITATLAIVALALAGCSSTADTANGSEVVRTKLSVGVLPTADSAALYLGIKKGFFEKQKLDVSIQIGAGGAALVPAVVSGSQQFAYSNVVSIMLGEDKGLPLQIVAAGDATGATPEDDFVQIVVKADSPIHTPADLAGKTIAANTLQNIVTLGVQGSLEKQGVDVSKVKFLEIGFPDMQAALATGQVDAISVSEPFLAKAKLGGVRVISAGFEPIYPKLTIGAYFTTRSYASQNPGVVKRFQDAMVESLNYAQNHPDEVRTELQSYAKISPEIAKELTLPNYDSSLNTKSMEVLADLMVHFGYTKTKPDVSKLTAGAR